MTISTLKKLTSTLVCRWAIATSLVIVLPNAAAADVLLSATPTSTYTPNPGDLYDLDHHYMFTWKIPAVDLKGGALVNAAGTVVGAATLTFQNMYNWNSSANDLFLWLLDDAKDLSAYSTTYNGTNQQGTKKDLATGGAVSWYKDDASSTVTTLNDNFATNPTWMVPSTTTAKTKLDQQTFPYAGVLPGNGPGPDSAGFVPLPSSGPLVGGTWYYTADASPYRTVDGQSRKTYDYTYVFTDAQVQALNNYAALSSAGGTAVALGFDPDCAYYNEGVAFNVFTAPTSAVPEPASLMLLATGLFVVSRRYRGKANKA